MANVIYRGPVSREPETINLPVAGAYKPGLFVTSDGSELTQATTGTGRLLLLGNLRAIGQGPDEAYVSGETGVAYRIEGEQEYTAQFTAGTYNHGARLTVDSNSRMAAATTGAVVVAFYDGPTATFVNGDRGDIVIATNSHVSA
jgi:hypothetical protein